MLVFSKKDLNQKSVVGGGLCSFPLFLLNSYYGIKKKIDFFIKKPCWNKKICIFAAMR
jgi:hypothetical protein